MNEQLDHSWPSGWTGNAVIDCGANGRLGCKICVDGDLSPAHRRNYQEILRRWPDLWPEIDGVLSGMLDPDNRLHQIRNPGASLIISVPAQPIGDGISWSVAVEFSHDSSVWDVPIDGWNPTSTVRSLTTEMTARSPIAATPNHALQGNPAIALQLQSTRPAGRVAELGLGESARLPSTMPIFVQSGEFYGVSYITGPAHVLLQVTFSSVPVSEPSIVALPAVSALPHTALDPQQICSAVLDAAATTNAELGTAFFPSVIRYVTDDFPRYPLYGHCANLLIRRLASGEPFAPATNVAI